MSREMNNNKILCHLCNKKVLQSDWTIEKHRGKCANDHMHLLIMFQHHEDICCPLCDGPLLFWPKKGPLTFKCTKSGLSVLNNGENRLCCFYCDYNLSVQALQCSIPIERISIEDDEEPPPDYEEIIF